MECERERANGGKARWLYEWSRLIDYLAERGHRDLRRRPLAERRRVLEGLLDDLDMVLPCRRLPDDGAKAWAVVEERGFEGMVAKFAKP
jgi:ATP-dependent DNA ligase